MKSCLGIAVSMALLASQALADYDGVLITLEPDNHSLTSEGYFLYQDHCAACHGVDLEGQEGWANNQDADTPLAPAHDDTGHSWHHADDELFEMTKFGFDILMGWEEGRSGMPGYADSLSDTEILAILSFMKSTWSPQSRQWQDQVNALFSPSWEPFTNPELQEK